jgi:hypothetical protein
VLAASGSALREDVVKAYVDKRMDVSRAVDAGGGRAVGWTRFACMLVYAQTGSQQ